MKTYSKTHTHETRSKISQLILIESHANQTDSKCSFFILIFSESDLCPVMMFKLYKSKLNKDLQYLWQCPKSGKIHYTDEVWYDRQCVGHDPLEHYFKFLAKDTTLSSDQYTNHSIRATCITLLDNAQFEARHIIAITGHKSEHTIKQYSRKCPNEKKRQMSDALATPIMPKLPKITDQSVKSEEASTPVQPQPPTFDLNAMDLFPIDDNDDVLINFINANPDFDKALQPVETQKEPTPAPPPLQADINIQRNVQNVHNVQNFASNLPSVIPKMYFSGSNATINYNFHSK